MTIGGAAGEVPVDGFGAIAESSDSVRPAYGTAMRPGSVALERLAESGNTVGSVRSIPDATTEADVLDPCIEIEGGAVCAACANRE